MIKIQCVYKITNIVNGKFYVGSTIDFNRRVKNHFNLLRNGAHHSIKLQNSFKKHDEINFIMEIIELVHDISKLIETEQKWIDTLKPEYNMTQLAGLNSHLGMKRSEETKQKISKALTGKKQSPEHIEANRKGHLGLTQSDESKKKKSDSLKRAWVNNNAFRDPKRLDKIKETRIKNGGYIVSEDMKKRISETLKSKNLQSAVGLIVEKYDLDGNLLETYPSILKAEKLNGFKIKTLSYHIVKRKKEFYNGFKWIIKYERKE